MTFFSLQAQEALTESAVLALLEPAQIIYFGEMHNLSEVLTAQLWVLEQLEFTTLVLEMFNIEQQPLLDQYIAGTLSIEQLQNAYSESNENFPLEHYIQLIDLAKQKGIRVLAGFIPRTLASRVVREGVGVLNGYSHFPKSAYKAGHADHLQIFQAMIPPAMQQRFSIDNFFAAQVLKDSSMAYVISQEIHAHSNSRILAICGHGHCDYGYGVPERVDSHADSVIITTSTNFNLPPTIADLALIISKE